jgi:hypothetical protein
MSAAEKLRALDRDSNLRPCYVFANGEERDITEQLVAVVEAAERMSHSHPPKHDPPCGLGSCELATVLAALDEALT